jgi:predicted DNA-binding ribbon-helix-helix protein
MPYREKKFDPAGSIFGPSHPNSAAANSEALALRPAFPRRPNSEYDGGPSSLVMHNLVVDGHRTTVRLEPVIWDALRDIARQQEVTVHDLVSAINRRRIASSLSSAIRAYVVVYLSARLRPAPPTRVSKDHPMDPALKTRAAFSAPRTGK